MGFSQTNKIAVKAIYGKVFLAENANLEAIKDPVVKARVNSVIGSFKKLDYLLLSNGTESTFQFQDKLQNDGAPVNKAAVGKGGGNGIYYLNIDEKKLLHKIHIFGKYYRLAYQIPHYKWKIHKESKTIAGYTCYRATATFETDDFRGKSTRQLEAWYSPELPAYIGPADFLGLPGMVLEGGSGNIRFRIKSLDIKKREVTIKKPTEGKLVTFDAFVDIFNTKMQEIINRN